MMLAHYRRRSRRAAEVSGLHGSLASAIDVAYFMPIAASISGHGARDADAVNLYLSADVFRLISPNKCFDESWYRHAYGDVAQGIRDGAILSGLAHFILYGAAEGRLPNADYAARVARSAGLLPPARDRDEAVRAIAADDELRTFMRLFPALDPVAFYNGVGRHLVPVRDGGLFAAVVRESFDAAFYRAEAGFADDVPADELLTHYFAVGAGQGLSPTPEFDERFYLAFYDDVRETIRGGSGTLACGYEHYVVAGRREGRLPRHELTATLSARFRGIADPVAVARTRDLEDAIRPPRVRPAARRERVVYVILPDLNPDIFFGGYQAIVALMTHLLRAGHRLALIQSSRTVAGIEYFLYHQRDPAVRALFRAVPTFSRGDELEVGRNDRFLAYSGWDALIAAELVRHTDEPRFSFLIQEYEPIFYEHNAFRLMLETAYAAPHHAIFNSAALRDHFRAQRIGVFASGGAGGHSVFEHVLTPPAPAAAQDEVRTFFVYARPEAHASRNLFELCVLALRTALARVTLTREWRFVGGGALAEHGEVPLGGPHRLRLRARMAPAEYAAVIAGTYAGLSLMYAPHPSLVPFELAQAGALVVTNTHGNRDAAFFAGISANIVAAAPTLDAIADAVAAALERADQAPGKSCAPFAGIWSPSWDDAFRPVVATLAAEHLV